MRTVNLPTIVIMIIEDRPVGANRLVIHFDIFHVEFTCVGVFNVMNP